MGDIKRERHIRRSAVAARCRDEQRVLEREAAELMRERHASNLARAAACLFAAARFGRVAVEAETEADRG